MELRQQDFAGGAVRGVARHLIPENGVYSIENGLLDDDGSIYRRGGSAYVSTAFGAALTWIWDGFLAGGQRTVFASASAFGVLGADDATPVSLGGGGLAAPVRAVVLDGILFIPGGKLYAGSRKAADYSTGTVTVNNGSATVTGVGTAWLANVDAGMLLRLAGRYYVVRSVDSDTQITLAGLYQQGSLAGQAYTLSRLGDTSTHGLPAGSIFAVVANRLLVCSGRSVRFSDGVDPDTGELRSHSWPVDNEHELPAGANIVAAEGIRDRALVLTTAGVWMVSNMAFNIVDFGGNPGHRVEQVDQELVCWGPAGVAGWRGSLVVPGVSDIYLVDGLSQSVPISRAARSLYREYVAAGYKPGGAWVGNAHYFLPILNASNAVVDLLVFRLDRPVETALGVIFPWSQVTGHAGNVRAVALRVASGTPQIRAAGNDGRVLNLTGLFAPSAALKRDADASNYEWVIETRDYPTDSGYGRENTVLRMIARYELTDGGSDNPHLSAYASVGRSESGLGLWGELWGTLLWSDSTLAGFSLLEGLAPEDDGRSPWAWQVIKSARYVRFRLSTSDPAAKLVLRSIEVHTRERRR